MNLVTLKLGYHETCIIIVIIFGIEIIYDSYFFKILVNMISEECTGLGEIYNTHHGEEVILVI